MGVRRENGVARGGNEQVVAAGVNSSREMSYLRGVGVGVRWGWRRGGGDPPQARGRRLCTLRERERVSVVDNT